MPTPAPSPALTHQELGVLSTHLALTFPLWIRRRKTCFTYVDDTTIVRRQSVDFRLPSLDSLPPQVRPGARERIYVPLDITDKEPLVKFSVFDEEGARLTLLNTGESSGLAVAGLNAIVNGLSNQPGRAFVLRNSVRPIIRRIVTSPRERGPAVARGALLPTRPLGSVLVKPDVYRALVRDLAAGFLMLVPVEYEPERDRCLKIEYETKHTWHADYDHRIPRFLARLLPSLAVADKVQRFGHLPIGWAQGTHFEFEAPPDVTLGKATLHCVQWDPHHRRRVRIRDRREVFDRPSINLNVSPRVQFDPARGGDARRRALLQCRQDVADVELRLRPVITSVLLPVTVASIATTIVLLVLAVPHIGELDGQTSAALLLLFSALLAAFLARPGEHAFATRLLRGVRCVTGVIVVCALVAVGVIGSGLVREEPPPATPSAIACEPRNAASGAGRHPRYRLVDLTCTATTPAAPRGDVRDGARLAVVVTSWVAFALTLLLVIGLVVTGLKMRKRAATADRDSQRATEVNGSAL